MNWTRCPRCGTVGDLGHKFCTGCGAERAKFPARPGTGPGAPSLRIPDVELEAAGDAKKTSTLMIVFSIFGIVGVLVFLTNDRVEPLIRIACGFAVVAGIIVWILSATKVFGTQLETTGRIFLKAFAVVGMVVGAIIALGVAAIILLFVVCATGGMRM